MNPLRIIAILAIPLVQTICILLGFRFEQYYYTFAIAAFLLTDLLLVPFFSHVSQKMTVFSYSFPPLALILSVFGLLFFLESEGIKTAALSLNALVQFQYMLSLYFALFKPERFQMRSFTHSVNLMSIAFLFSMSSIVYGLAYFVDMPYWYSFPPLLLLLFLLYCQQLVIHGFTIRDHRLFLGAMLLISSEIFLGISLLPSIYYVNASLWTAFCMPVLYLSLASLKKERTRFETIATVAVTAFVVFLIISSAQWR